MYIQPGKEKQQQTPHVPAETTPRKRTSIKITDPNSGKDLTSEILKKDKTPVSKRISNPVKISAPASTTPVKSSPVVATAEKKQDISKIIQGNTSPSLEKKYTYNYESFWQRHCFCLYISTLVSKKIKINTRIYI